MVGQIDWGALERSDWTARPRAGAYAPYSKFSVGTAVLIDSGEIFNGAAIENVSFSLTSCEERAAIIAVQSSICRSVTLSGVRHSWGLSELLAKPFTRFA